MCCEHRSSKKSDGKEGVMQVLELVGHLDVVVGGPRTWRCQPHLVVTGGGVGVVGVCVGGGHQPTDTKRTSPSAGILPAAATTTYPAYMCMREACTRMAHAHIAVHTHRSAQFTSVDSTPSACAPRPLKHFTITSLSAPDAAAAAPTPHADRRPRHVSNPSTPTYMPVRHAACNATP